MLSNQLNKRQQGVSLLSTAITLAIVSFVGAASLLSYSEQGDLSRWQQTDAKLNLVKKALVKFANENSYMPCPTIAGANGGAYRESVEGEVSVNPIAAQPAQPATAYSPYVPPVPAVNPQVQITNVPVNRCWIDQGEVPYALLGLSAADVQDAWGNSFIYAVDRGVTSANAMLDCLSDADPAQTACFFNNSPLPTVLSANNPDIKNQYSALPWYGLTTQPLSGGVSPTNLNICSDVTCTAFSSIGQIAVLVALNENGLNNIGAGTAQAENNDGDNNFVVQDYSQTPFFDDLVIGISAHDLNITNTLNAIESSVSVGGGPSRIGGRSSQDLGQTVASKGLGPNDAKVELDEEDISIDSQVIRFGQQFAGKKVVMTLDTLAFGTWDQPDHWGTEAHVDGENVSDSAMIKVNGEFKILKYDHARSTPKGEQPFDNDFKKLKEKHKFYDPARDKDGSYKEGETNREEIAWTDSHEMLFELDENGNANIDFIVATTGTDERVNFNDVELVLYDTPPLVPDFPMVTLQEGDKEIFLGGRVDPTSGSYNLNSPVAIGSGVRVR